MDARSLLRQKREAARVEHPYASYASGSLRCTVCAVAVKDGGAWDGHLGSKAHRKNLARVREEQKAQEQRKRPAPEDEPEPEPARADKKRRVEPPAQPNAGGRFPADFFSDPSRALATNDDDEDEDDAEPAPAPAPAPAQEKSQLDLEWEAFQASVVNANLAAEAQDDTMARATVVAEPELFEELPQGFPAALAERRRAAQAALQPAAAAQETPIEKKEETPEERERRRAEEEKEEIMSRILEEERLQEEADNKVAQLKARLELIKRQRAAKQKAQ